MSWSKRLGLLHELVPGRSMAVLVNPANAQTYRDPAKRRTQRPVPSGLQIQVLNASTSREIDAAFATLCARPADAL